MSNVIEFKPKAKSVEQGEKTSAASIDNTAAGQVVQALLFYARNGWDEGARAKKALIGMQTVIVSKEDQPKDLA